MYDKELTEGYFSEVRETKLGAECYKQKLKN